MKSFIFHIPHDGSRMPRALKTSCIISQKLLNQYHDDMCDKHVTKLIPKIKKRKLLRFRISRLFCDVERFLDERERMNQYGMGFCYEKAYDGKPVKQINTALKEKTANYYFTHHRRVDTLVQKICMQGKSIVFFDMHSFSEETVLPSLQESGKQFPDVCIGFENNFCSQDLLTIVNQAFCRAGFSVAFNYPYQGSFVPNWVLKQNESNPAVALNKMHDVVSPGQVNFQSIMLEFNKKIYLKNGKVIHSQAKKIQSVITNIIMQL